MLCRSIAIATRVGNTRRGGRIERGSKLLDVPSGASSHLSRSIVAHVFRDGRSAEQYFVLLWLLSMPFEEDYQIVKSLPGLRLLG